MNILHGIKLYTLAIWIWLALFWSLDTWADDDKVLEWTASTDWVDPMPDTLTTTGTATTSGLVANYPNAITTVELVDGKLIVTRKEKKYMMTCTLMYGVQNDCEITIERAWKEVYVATEPDWGICGTELCSTPPEIVLEKVIEGKIIPSHTTPERIEWIEYE